MRVEYRSAVACAFTVDMSGTFETTSANTVDLRTLVALLKKVELTPEAIAGDDKLGHELKLAVKKLRAVVETPDDRLSYVQFYVGSTCFIRCGDLWKRHRRRVDEKCAYSNCRIASYFYVHESRRGPETVQYPSRERWADSIN